MQVVLSPGTGVFATLIASDGTWLLKRVPVARDASPGARSLRDGLYARIRVNLSAAGVRRVRMKMNAVSHPGQGGGDIEKDGSSLQSICCLGGGWRGLSLVVEHGFIPNQLVGV